MKQQAVFVVAAMAAALVVVAGMALVGPVKPAEATFKGQNGNIVYTVSDANDREIYTAPVTGGTPTKLTNNSTDEGGATFSPDGKRILYQNSDGHYDTSNNWIYTMSSSGGTPTTLVQSTTVGRSWKPVWSPDGTKIAYLGLADPTSYNRPNGYGIYVVPASGGTPTKLANASIDSDPVWSPDGTKVAYTNASYINSEGVASDWEIYTVPVTGGTPTKLTENSTDERHNFTWSPDGKKILYSGHDGTDYDLYVVSAEGGTSTPLVTNSLTNELYPAYSPDGTKIAYQFAGSTNHGIYMIPASGGTPTKLMEDAPYIGGWERLFRWSPDSTKIAYEDYETRDMYTISASGGTPNQLSHVQGGNQGGRNLDDWGVAWDEISPVMSQPPTQTFVLDSMLGTSTSSNVPITLQWAGYDITGGSGISSYQLQQSTNGGTYSDVTLSASPSLSTTRSLAPYNTYRFRTRAQDKAGNLSDWTYGPPFTVTPYQEDNSRISYSGSWTRSSLSGAYGGLVKYTRASGATAKLSFTGRNIAWIATKGSEWGSAEVWIDGVKVTTVDMWDGSSTSDFSTVTTSPRKVVFTKSWPSSGSHTIDVRPLGTWNHPRADVDAFVILGAPILQAASAA